MTAEKFAGVYSALVTPFDHKGHLDLDAFIKLLSMQEKAGINGVVIAGSTGEAPTLNIEERMLLIKTAKKNSSLPIIAGAGSNSTQQAIKLQKAMEDAGADATLQVSPYYNKPTQDGLYRHFMAIAKESSTPIILYNVSSRTGVSIDCSTVIKIAKECPNIIGIKDATTDGERTTQLLSMSSSLARKFLVLAGEDSAFLSTLALGGHGIISACAQVASHEMVAIYNCMNNNDLYYAQKITQKLHGFIKLMFSHTNPIPIKTLLARLGLIDKTFRSPLYQLNEQQENELINNCIDFKFINNLKELS